MDILQCVLDTLQVFEDYGLNGLKKSHDLSAMLFFFFLEIYFDRYWLKLENKFQFNFFYNFFYD